VRQAEDVVQAKALSHGIPVIAKIEKPEAIENLDEIMDVADGVMVARGDLGVEFGHEKVPVLQKRIVAEVRPRAKPVITATQMLESMTTNATPTRAEASDVANAVLDGTDAVMLSGETAAGRHPVLVVKTMAKIIDEVESSAGYSGCHGNPVARDRSFSSAIAEAATSAAREFGLKALAVYTESGRSASFMSAERPAAPVIAFTRHDAVLRRLALLWGVMPVHGEWVKGVAGVVEQAEREMVRSGVVVAGDPVAITFGMRLGDEPFQTNMMKLWRIRENMGTPLTPAGGQRAE
jgi:pyruvate kinase